MKRPTQDSFEKYTLDERKKKAGSLRGRHPVHIPELRVTVYIKNKNDEDAILEKYLNKPINPLENKLTQKEAI